MKTFTDFTNSWFDKVADWATENPGEAHRMFKGVSKSPTKSNVMRLGLDGFKFDGSTELQAHRLVILNKAFRQEYRHSFGGKACKGLQDLRYVSAASCFYDLVRQALKYND